LLGSFGTVQVELPNDKPMNVLRNIFHIVFQGGMDVAVLSPKSNLSVAHYRMLKNGTIKMGKISNFSEIADKKKGMKNHCVRIISYICF
jgi:hypothetical protein